MLARQNVLFSCTNLSKVAELEALPEFAAEGYEINIVGLVSAPTAGTPPRAQPLQTCAPYRAQVVAWEETELRSANRAELNGRWRRGQPRKFRVGLRDLLVLCEPRRSHRAVIFDNTDFDRPVRHPPCGASYLQQVTRCTLRAVRCACHDPAWVPST
eukprot:SAG11_NODE_635_length_8040_cov_3.233472_6_plen_157_part_00